MAVDISWEIEGVKEFNRTLENITTDLKDFSEPLDECADNLLKSFETNYAAQGGLFGGWSPLARSTIERKIQKGWSLNILEATGKMRKNFEKEVTKDYARLFNPTSYFKYHQSRGSRTKLPRRVMMMIDKKRKDKIIESFRNFILRVTGKAKDKQIWKS